MRSSTSSHIAAEFVGGFPFHVRSNDDTIEKKMGSANMRVWGLMSAGFKDVHCAEVAGRG